MTTQNPTAAGADAGTRPSTANRVGFVLASLLALGDVSSVAQPTPEGEVGPPFVVLAVGAVLGVVTLAGVWLGWARRSRAGVRTAAASRLLSMILALPAFFVEGLPAWIRAATAAAVLVTILSVVLMLARPTPGGAR